MDNKGFSFNETEINNLDKISGIYIIKNSKSGKSYVGESINVKERLKTHLLGLNALYHPNKDLNKDYLRDGGKYFLFELIETMKPVKDRTLLKEKLKEREQYWINQFQKEKLYNRETGKIENILKNGSGIVVIPANMFKAVKTLLKNHPEFIYSGINDLVRDLLCNWIMKVAEYDNLDIKMLLLKDKVKNKSILLKDL